MEICLTVPALSARRRRSSSKASVVRDKSSFNCRKKTTTFNSRKNFILCAKSYMKLEISEVTQEFYTGSHLLRVGLHPAITDTFLCIKIIGIKTIDSYIKKSGYSEHRLKTAFCIISFVLSDTVYFHSNSTLLITRDNLKCRKDPNVPVP